MNEYTEHRWKVTVAKSAAEELFQKLDEQLNPNEFLSASLKIKNPVGKFSHIEFAFFSTVLDPNAVHTRLIRALAEINDNDWAEIDKKQVTIWKR